MARATVLLAVPALILLATTAQASYMTVSNQRLDRALYQGHGPREVLAGRIGAIRQRGGEYYENFPYHRDFDFHVEGVVLGDAARKGVTLTLTGTSFDWPAVLVPFANDTPCILVLKPHEREEGVDARILTVVPTARLTFTPAPTRKAAMRVLADVLLEELRGEKSESRLRHLLLLAALVLEPKDAPVLVPRLDAKSKWTRRAALSALVLATRDKAYVDRAVQDLEAFLRSTPPTKMLPPLDVVPASDRSTYAPYPVLMDHYFFLTTNWGEEETAGLVPMLPMFRAVAREMKGAEIQRWRHGVDALCRIGTREDVDLLWAYAKEVREDPKHPQHDRPYVRYALVEGMSRILGIENEASLAHEVPLDGPVGTVLRGEADQLERIRRALDAR